MDIQKLQRLVDNELEDVKAQDIKVFNTSHITSLFDRVVVATGISNRQTRALASSVMDQARAHSVPVVACEGEEAGKGVLVGLGDAAIHCTQPALLDRKSTPL